jgi:hypothetical protein
MRPFCDTRVGDLVLVGCGCGNSETLTASMLGAAGLALYAQ